MASPASPPPSPALSRIFSWLFTGNLAYAACQWGVLIILAKLGNPETVGQFNLGLAVTAPILILTNLELNAIQVTDTEHRYQMGDYLGLRVLTTGMAVLCIPLVSLLVGYSWPTLQVIGLVGLVKICESLSELFYGFLLQGERHSDRIAKSLMLRGSLGVGLVLLGFGLTQNLLLALWGLLLSRVVVLLGYDLPGVAQLLQNSSQRQAVLRPRWDPKVLRSLVWTALPMGGVTLLVALNANIPRYLIDHFLGARELGIFAALAYLMMVGDMVIGTLGVSAIPRLAKYYTAADVKAFYALLFKLMAIAALLGGGIVLGAMLVGKELLTLLYRPEYGLQVTLFIWLMAAAAVEDIASLLGRALTATRHFRIQLPLAGAVTMISAIATLYLLPLWGLQGAAVALLISALVQILLSCAVLIPALARRKPSIGLS